MLFRQYLLNNGEKVVLEAIEKPCCEYASFKEPLVAALEHEQFVTASINAIYDAAYQVKDFRTMQFLDRFVKEQGIFQRNSTSLQQAQTPDSLDVPPPAQA